MSNGNWWQLPEPVLLKILLYLSTKDVVNCGMVCKRWHEVANIDYLWHKMFLRDYDLQPDIARKPGSISWRVEYIRISTEIPLVNTDILYGHTNQVLHVSFSHNGKWFATCSKDATCIVWTATHPATIKYTYNMDAYSWRETQWSAFNKSDTALLICGEKHESPFLLIKGKIAVYAINGKDGATHFKCVVENDPYESFSAWFNETCFLSSYWDLKLILTNWLDKSNYKPKCRVLCRFLKLSSRIHYITVADCPWFVNGEEEAEQQENAAVNPWQHPNVEALPPLAFNSDDSTDLDSDIEDPMNKKNARPLTIFYADGFHRKHGRKEDLSSSSGRKSRKNSTKSSPKKKPEPAVGGSENTPASQTNASSKDRVLPNHSKHYVESSSDDDKDQRNPRCVIFAARDLTCKPNQIAIKWMKKDKSPKIFDALDKVFEMHGQIMGMTLSPDHRYLYVNVRAWPRECKITSYLEPPHIAQEADINVIDLKRMMLVGKTYRAHEAFTSSTFCGSIFLSASEDYVASGATDHHAYIWDRYYGMCLAKYPHDDVVNSVAFSPKRSDLLVTTSDDHTIKVWRSRAKAKRLKAKILGEAVEVNKKQK